MQSEFLTTHEAAAVLGCSEVHARRLLKYADDLEELGNGRFRALYARCRVLRLASDRECQKCAERLRERGLRSCRTCGEKFHPEEMISGKCQHCRAHDLCRNFLCHGDCFKCPIPDRSLLQFLKHAIDEYDQQTDQPESLLSAGELLDCLSRGDVEGILHEFAELKIVMCAIKRHLPDGVTMRVWQDAVEGYAKKYGVE